MKENKNLTELELLREEKAELTDQIRSFADNDNPSDDDLAAFDEAEARASEIDSRLAVLERTRRAKELTNQKRSSYGPSTLAIKSRRAPNQEDWTAAFKAWALNTPSSRREIADDWKRSADLLDVNFDSNVWQTRAQATDVTNRGEEFINDSLYAGHVEARAAYGGLMNISRVINVPTAESRHYATDNDTANVGKAHSAQNDSVDNTNIVTDKVTITPTIYSSGVYPVSIQMVRDANVDIISWIGRKLARRVMKKIETDAVTALLAAVTTYGAYGYSNNIAADNLSDLWFAIDPDYRVSPRFKAIGNDATRKSIYQTFLNDQSGVYLNESLAEAPMKEFLGTDYVTVQEMPSMASGVPATPMILGDFEYSVFHVVGSPQFHRLDELYKVSNLAVGFVEFWESGYGVLDPGNDALQGLRTGTLSGD